MLGESLVFTIPGRPVSNNSIARVSRGRVHKSPKAREYQDTAIAYATVAVKLSGWKKPECAYIYLVIYNSATDVDNIPKLIFDSLRGIAIVDDKRKNLRGFMAVHDLDWDGPRVEVTVTACPPLVRPKKTSVQNRTKVSRLGADTTFGTTSS